MEDTTSGSCSSIESPEASDDLLHHESVDLFDSPSAPSPTMSIGNSNKGSARASVGDPIEREGHNAMERIRRVNIRKCFESLQNSIPELRAKRAHSLQILQEGAKYIHYLRSQEAEIMLAKAELIKRNHDLRAQIARMKLNMPLQPPPK